MTGRRVAIRRGYTVRGRAGHGARRWSVVRPAVSKPTPSPYHYPYLTLVEWIIEKRITAAVMSPSCEAMASTTDGPIVSSKRY